MLNVCIRIECTVQYGFDSLCDRSSNLFSAVSVATGLLPRVLVKDLGVEVSQEGCLMGRRLRGTGAGVCSLDSGDGHGDRICAWTWFT